MRKGQAAMEFLMTYGWAILVVLISIGALAYFGVNKAEQFLPEKCLIATSSGIFCEEFSTSSSADTVTLRLRNILPDPVSVSSITLDDPSCAAAAGGVTTGIVLESWFGAWIEAASIKGALMGSLAGAVATGPI